MKRGWAGKILCTCTAQSMVAVTHHGVRVQHFLIAFFMARKVFDAVC